MTANQPAPKKRSRLRKIGTRLLIGVVVLATLLFLFSSFENRRGRKAFLEARAELQAIGLDIDWSRSVPEPVTDEQNLVLAPIMNGCYQVSPPFTIETWQGEPVFGETADETGNKVQKLYAPYKPGGVEDVFGFPVSDTETLDVFGNRDTERFKELAALIEPYRNALSQLRAACTQYPDSYLPGDYTVAVSSPIPAFKMLRPATRLLTAEALLAFHTGDSALALENCRALRRISDLNPQVPLLVNVMMEAVVVRSHLAEILWTGLSDDAFTSDQLKEVLSLCKQIDLVNQLGQAFTCELRASSDALLRFAESPIETARLFGSEGVPMLIGAEGDWHYMEDYLVSLLWHFIPAKGWNLQMHARYLRFTTPYYTAFDIEEGTIDLDLFQKMEEERQRLEETGSFFDSQTLMVAPAYQKVAQVSIDTQRRIDLLTIAATLCLHAKAGEPLPEDIASNTTFPTDPANSSPYHYSKSNDSFTLSSPGKDGLVDTSDNLVIHWAPR